MDSAADIVAHRWEGPGGRSILAYVSDGGDRNLDLEAVRETQHCDHGDRVATYRSRGTS